MLKKYNEFLKESVYGDKGMTYNDISDIMLYITDEFPELGFSVENPLQSGIIKNDDKSFIIQLFDKTIDFPNDMPTLYHIEPKIHDLIYDVHSQLSGFGLKVFYSDFGSTDAYYELVITEIGHKPQFIPERYDNDGNPN
jgi:hypothetical protein